MYLTIGTVVLSLFQWIHRLTRRYKVTKWRQNKECFSPIRLDDGDIMASSVNRKTAYNSFLFSIIALKPDIFVK